MEEGIKLVFFVIVVICLLLVARIAAKERVDDKIVNSKQPDEKSNSRPRQVNLILDLQDHIN